MVVGQLVLLVLERSGGGSCGGSGGVPISRMLSCLRWAGVVKPRRFRCTDLWRQERFGGTRKRVSYVTKQSQDARVKEDAPMLR